MIRRSLYSIVALISFSALVHFPGIGSPLLDYQAYRQCQTASMARNYARHGMHFFTPELDTEGRPARAGTEFPVYSYVLALLFKVFGTREALGRLLSSLFAAWGAIFLYLFVRPRLGEARALASGLVMCALPIHIYFTRSVQPEPMALWGLLGFLYYMDRHLNRKGDWKDWTLAVLLGALAPLLKLPFLYVLFPLWAYLGWERYGWKAFQRPAFLGSLAVLLGLTGAWYHYAKSALVSVLPLSAEEHWKNLRPIFTLKLWENHFISRLPELCFTYPGLLFGIGGAYLLYREGQLRLWAVWFGATALYIVLLGEYGQIHRYTELLFAPVNAVFIAAGIVGMWYQIQKPVWKILWGILVLGIPVHAGLRIAHWYRWEYPWVFEARQVIAKLSGPEELVITNAREHPVLLYYIDRYGFSPDLGEVGFDALAGYQAKGAHLFLTPTDESWARHPEWKTYFAKHARLLHEDPRFRVYRLF